MKYRNFLAVAIILFVAASCVTHKKDLNQQLIGLWAGVDTIQITSVDTSGAIAVETIAVPVVIEYFADTTMTGKVHYNDSTAANIEAVILVGDPRVSYSGVMNINDTKQHIHGELFYNENPESLTMEFVSTDPASGTQHKGTGILARQSKAK